MDLNKTSKDQLLKIEQEQIKEIERRGLIRRVHHRGPVEPQEAVTPGQRLVMAIGRTIVNIYDPTTLKERDDKKGFVFEGAQPRSSGEAVCSASEGSYNRRVGRILATGRAIRRLPKCQKSPKQ